MTTAPPQYGQGQPQPALEQPTGQTNLIVTQRVIWVPLTEAPMNMVCPYCHQHIVTGTVYETGTYTWIACMALCLLGCNVFSFVPFCCDSCKDTVHTCPSCRSVIGRHKKTP